VSPAAGRPAVVGVDVAARSLHAVALDGDGRLVAAEVFSAGAVDDVVAWSAGTRVAAIDGPHAASPGLHRDDGTIAAKFRSARTGEVALGRHHRHWVSWVTPAEVPDGTWMAAAIALHAAFRAAGVEPLEVYPHAAFAELAGGRRLPSKQRPDGLAARVALLRAEVGDVPHLPMWSHDGLDACVAAVVAADRQAGVAVAAGPRSGDPAHADGDLVDDGSRIWLPRRRPAAG
jgi:predicted nuclease with RNAse H fold